MKTFQNRTVHRTTKEKDNKKNYQNYILAATRQQGYIIEDELGIIEKGINIKLLN